MPRMHGEHKRDFALRQQEQSERRETILIRDSAMGAGEEIARRLKDIYGPGPVFHAQRADGQKVAAALLPVLLNPRQVQMNCTCRLIPHPHLHHAGEPAAEHPIW